MFVAAKRWGSPCLGDIFFPSIQSWEAGRGKAISWFGSL